MAAVVILAIAAAGAIGWFVATPGQRNPALDQAKVEPRPAPPIAAPGPVPNPAPAGGQRLDSPTAPDLQRGGASQRGQRAITPPPVRASNAAPVTPPLPATRGTAPQESASIPQAPSSAAAPVQQPVAPVQQPAAPVQQPAPASSAPPSPVPQAKGSARLVGCWMLPNSAQIVVTSDHAFNLGGVIKGTWDSVDDSVYLMQWPDEIGQAELTSDGRRLALTGKVTYTLIRRDAGSAIVGEWRFAEGNPVTVTFTPDGSFQLLAIRGKWRVSAGNPRVFALIWPGARASSVVSADNQSVNVTDPMYGAAGVLKRVACAPAER